MSSLDILFLNQEEVKECGGNDIKLFIKTMEEVMSLHDKKDYVLPNKAALRWGDINSEISKGRINSMPGYIGGEYDSCGIKWISSSPMNPTKYNLPRATGVIILNDTETLVPLAIMDGTVISAMRTGAISGVVTKHLARPESKIVGLIGAGVQNRTQLLAIHASLEKIELVKIFDINEARAKSFAEEMGNQLGITIQVVDSAEMAVRGSDVFVTATVTKEPIVKKDWVEEGSLYIHVGSHECEFDVITSSNKIVVDDWEELKHRGVETISIMYANGQVGDDIVYASIGEVVNGNKKGRENDKEKIYFNSVGMGIEDVAMARIIYENAKKNNLGTKLSLWNEPTYI